MYRRMASDDSDDEPLSNLAAAKKLDPEKYNDDFDDKDDDYEPVKKKKKKIPMKKLSVTFKLSNKIKTVMTPTIIERPLDVWLYLKDLNPTGPYSCLLCSEWFINRAKIIVHYVLNHKKDFCGICRYFVPDREAWWSHVKFHTPWPCSQCIESFQTESALRQHLSGVHTLVHCRLCHFRVPDNDQYHTHLFQKHNVTNVSSKDEEVLWELEYDGSPRFLCFLCSKSNNLASTFFNHYMGYHHFTLKCFASIISGRDPPFTVSGADVSAQFVDGQLKDQTRLGYVDLEQKVPEAGHESDQSESNNLMNALIPEIKQEMVSDQEETKGEENSNKSKTENENHNDITNSYKGDEDFDITLMELIVLEKCYFNYVNQTLKDINSNLVPENSDIDYENAKSDDALDILCSLCKTKHNTGQTFATHMFKMHSVKSIPIYSCRVCATTFDTKNELENHISEELGDFEDLWMCQFCDKEFDNRESTRRHLTSHWEALEYDNCFSPHLGFKCKYCPTLFWNETDRETHQVRVHFNKHKDQYYKCEICTETFSDKIWFIHHYLEKHKNNEDKISIYLLKCCICCLVMSSVDEMRKHFESEHPEARKVFCSLDSCQYKPLSHRKSFKLHLKTVHSTTARTDRAVTCTVCGREFASNRACGAHMAQVHGPGKFKCKLCREVMHTMDERKLHYLIRHPGRHPFECSECGKSFQYKSSLYMHKQEHSPIKQTFTCNYCGKIFNKKDSFREHVQIHEGPRHACSYCPMRFVQRSNMLRHERRHTGERPYACPHCPRTFADKGACTSHVRTHSKEASYACLYCGQTFVQKSKLTYHIRKHTGENLETCSVCSKLFTSACSLREHMKTHASKTETVKCPLCDKKYRDERYMLRHLRTSHTSSQFTCPICRKILTSIAGLRHHVLTHGGQSAFQCKACSKAYSCKKTVMKHLRKRHGLKGTEYNIKDFYKRRDPRECELGLDEDVMISIFGRPKKTTNDICIGDFVTFTKKFNFAGNLNKDKSDDDGDGDETEECKTEGDNNKIVSIILKKEIEDDSEVETTRSTRSSDKSMGETIKQEELEPTDFVSVKIEPMDENHDDLE